MLKNLAKYASQGYGSVVGSRRFCSLLKNWLRVTRALRHSAGSLPVWRQRSKITCIIGAISSRNSLSMSGLSLSGPAALKGFMF